MAGFVEFAARFRGAIQRTPGRASAGSAGLSVSGAPELEISARFPQRGARVARHTDPEVPITASGSSRASFSQAVCRCMSLPLMDNSLFFTINLLAGLSAARFWCW
jgi:hypothetical protein